ncbi:MAG: phosphatidate cytidylyltransferase [Methylotenera sp.]|nr:phosphatidate cytidylyltransferase [Methylotenera sp.]
MLKKRVLTALVLVPSFLATLFLLPNLWWAILMLAITLVALQEWANLAKFHKNQTAIYLILSLVVGVVSMYLGRVQIQEPEDAIFQIFSLYAGMASVVFWLIFVPVWLLKQFQIKNKVLMAVLGWLLLLPLWGALVSLAQVSPRTLLGFMLLVWIADTAAYFAGKQFGKHKLAPTISPGKTWEGVLGALLAVSVYAVLVAQYVHLNMINTLAASTLLLGLSVMGDLFESMMKRQAGVKDSGNLLPGHGGVLDRIDALTSTLPAALLLILLINFN